MACKGTQLRQCSSLKRALQLQHVQQSRSNVCQNALLANVQLQQGCCGANSSGGERDPSAVRCCCHQAVQRSSGSARYFNVMLVRLHSVDRALHATEDNSRQIVGTDTCRPLCNLALRSVRGRSVTEALGQHGQAPAKHWLYVTRRAIFGSSWGEPSEKRQDGVGFHAFIRLCCNLRCSSGCRVNTAAERKQSITCAARYRSDIPVAPHRAYKLTNGTTGQQRSCSQSHRPIALEQHFAATHAPAQFCEGASSFAHNFLTIIRKLANECCHIDGYICFVNVHSGFATPSHGASWKGAPK